MPRAPRAIERPRLSDDLVQRVRELIRVRGHAPGDRLPTIVEMSRQFGVSHPTLREALRKLETLGHVEIRHGSGVYVGTDRNPLLIANPVFEGGITPKVLLDLVEARIPIELTCVALAAKRATNQQIAQMERQLALAGEDLNNAAVVREANLAFHGHIALASGNQILHQLLEVLGSIIVAEQHVTLVAVRARRRFHHEHLAILEAIARHDPDAAEERMQAHLNGVRGILRRQMRRHEAPAR